MRTRGFTLIELMISLALFGLIAAGAMSLVISGARMQTHSARVDLAQTSLRTAIDFIARDIMAAAAGTNGGTLLVSGGSTVNAIAFDTTVNNITSTSPYVDNTERLELYNGDGSTLAQLTAAANGGVSALTISYETAPTTTSPWQNNRFVAQTSPYPSFVELFDPNAKSAAIVQLNSASGTALSVAALPASFAAYTTFVMPARHVSYYVSNTTFGSTSTSNTSMLMMSLNGATNTTNGAPLAEGVEDMQVAYGFDTNADNIVTENGAALNDDEWLYNVVGGETPTAQMTMANLRTVRVTLVVKSTSIDSGSTAMPLRPQAEDHSAATSQDGFIRRVMRTEIAVRNMNL